MSDLLKDYRAKYPQYNDINDDQLVGALRQKYNTENGVEVSLEDFNASIGFKPMVSVIAEQAEPVDLKTPANKSFSLANTAKLTGERAGDVVGNVADFSSTVGTAAQEAMQNPTLILGRSRETLERAGVEPLFYIGDKGFGFASSEETQKIREVSPNVVKQAASALEGIDLGGKPGDQRTWQEVKGEPISNVLPFILETGIASLPDMAASIAAAPAYVASRSQEIGEQRAQNDGRDEPSLEDVIKAAPAAIAVTLLERFGGRGILGLDDAAITAIKQIPKEVGKAGAKEGATELVQGIIENAGASVDTKKGFDVEEALDEGLAGLVAGSGFGAGLRGGTAGVDVATQAVQNTPNAQIKRGAKDFIADIDAAIPSETGAEAATSAFDPDSVPISEKAPEAKTMGELVIEKRAQIRGITPEQLIEQDQPKRVPSDSSLNRTASWVIKNKETGDFLFETFDPKKVDALNTKKYEAIPILEYLQSLNKKDGKDDVLDRGSLERRGVDDGRSNTPEQVSSEGGEATPDNIAAEGLEGATREALPVGEPVTKRDDALDYVDEYLSLAKKEKQKPEAQGFADALPMLKVLVKRGGVKIGSPLHSELKNIGITNRTLPGIFRKESALGDADNIPLSEMRKELGVEPISEDGLYVDRDWVLKQISDTNTADKTAIENFVVLINNLGFDENAEPKELKAAIREYEAEKSFIDGLEASEVAVMISDLELEIENELKNEGIDYEIAGKGQTATIEDIEAINRQIEAFEKLEARADAKNQSRVKPKAKTPKKLKSESVDFGKPALTSEENIGTGSTKAMDSVAEYLGANIKNRRYDKKYGTGDKAILEVGNTALQFSVREDDRGIYLIDIAAKNIDNLSVEKKGSGLGTKAIEALKAYSDKTGKPFAVIGATESAKPFYEKFHWLKKANVKMFFDKNTYSPNDKKNTNFVYRPKSIDETPIADPVDGAFLEPDLEPVKASGAITVSPYTPTLKSQAAAIEKTQTETDARKSAELPVKEAELVKGKIVYPKPEADINTKEFIEADKKISKPLKPSEMVFHAPGHNYVGLFRSTGIPPRQEVVSINGRNVRVPDAPQRIEPIMADLVKIMGRRIYFGKIKGKSTEGFYRPDIGELRTRRKNDVEVLAHEMAHYLDMYSNETLPNFAKQYKNKKYVEQVKAFSYTDANQKIQEIEGFAEFVRHWLTNSQEAFLRAPTYYDAFNRLLKTDKALNKTMLSLQEKMHKFYFQGADKLGQALIGKERGFDQRFNEWAYRRDSRIRQQMIDRFHAARKVEQELTGKIGTVRESAWKQFRIAGGGSEGIADYILNYGTVNFDTKGDLKPTGKSLHAVLEPVKTIKVKKEHKGDAPIDLFLRYLAGRRAIELRKQGRENLIPKETAMTWARLGGAYPKFEAIAKDYQAFNDRMMDFYEEAGMITAEGRKLMQSLNKDYVPFNRIREQLAGSKQAGPAGFKKLRGGTANLNDILVNIQDGIVANVQSALNNRAKQRLYQYISGHKDGAIFATRLSPDSKLVKVHNDEMADKITDILAKNGIEVEGELDLTDPSLTSFWQHGVKPRVTESGNIVDTIIIDGKPRYFEVQDPLLQEMLLAMNPESYSKFMNVMFGIKNFFTRAITLGVEFTGANLVRDTTGAAFLSKNNFKPFLDSFSGMYSYIKKDKAYQDFLRSGAGYSSRIQALTKEGGARRRVKLDEFGVMTAAENILSTIDNIASAFEYGTRIGEFKVAKKNHRSDMDAGYAGREISTDFAVMGANHFLTGYMRTVPFLNAMVQSQDRVFREAVIKKKYDGNPTSMAMKAFLGITLPTLALYLVNRDDEDYQNIPDYERRTNWHIKVGENRFVKIPRPYDVGFVYATMPELFFKYVEDEKGKEFSDGMLWTLTQMYGIDGTPAMMTGWWDLVRNKKWTGAPVVPQSLSNVEATEQYTSNTSETFVRMGEALGISPVKAEHMFNAYTGYLGGYLLAGTDHMMWDEERFGPKPEKDVAESIFLKRFLTTEQRPNTSAMEKFFDLKEASDKVVATFKQQIDARRAIKGQMNESTGKFKSDKFYGLSGEEKSVLFALNDSMNQLVKLVYGKNGIKTAELAIKYNKNLTAEEKRQKIDSLWESRNKLFMDYYKQANSALEKAKAKAKKEN